jgi:Ribbon-helix-helix protein, copG family
MRTTVTLEPDVAAAVELLRRERHVGVSAAINELIRVGLGRPDATAKPFEQRTSLMNARIDVSNVAEALALLDDDASR